MNLHINGEHMTVPSSIDTIRELIDHFKIENPVIIVEQNEQILEKKDHDRTKVTAGDKIELIHFMGGG